jgi:hypothetical protein
MRPLRAKHTAVTVVARWLSGEGAGWASRNPRFIGVIKTIGIYAARVVPGLCASEVSMSRELLIEIVAELEALNRLLETRAQRLRTAAALMNEIEEYLDAAMSPAAPAPNDETVSTSALGDE